MRHTTLALLACFLGCTSQSAQTPPGEPLPSLDEARSLLRRQEFDEALLITDRILAAQPDNRDALLIASEGSLALFMAGREGRQYLLADAERSLRAALEIERDDADTWLKLAHCYYLSSEFEDGSAAAKTAVEILGARHAPKSEIAQGLIAVADNEMQLFVASRREELATGEKPTDETTRLANQVLMTLGYAKAAGAVGTASLKSALVYQWLGRGKDALQLLEDGIRAEPTHNGLHTAYQQQFFDLGMRKECVAAYRRMLEASGGNSALEWFLGRAQVALGDDHRKKTAWADAEKAYADALRTYRKYDADRPANHETTSQWIAICELSMGRVIYEQGDFDRAQGHYEAAFDASPLVAEVDAEGRPRLVDSFGGNYVGGLYLVGQAKGDAAGANGSRDSLAYFERIIERHPGKFGAIYNNAGLAARELGSQVAGRGPGTGNPTEAAADNPERQRRLAQAMELWEKSYRYYEKAVELEPNDARILNDCGLLLVYHLNRDYDRAREVFDRAIEVGTAQLAELADDASEDERNFYEEAVGDAYQNIGRMLLVNLGRPGEEARPFLVQSVKFYPYQRRSATQMLRRIDGGGERRPRPAQDPREGAFNRRSEAAKKLAAAGDFDAALLELDGLAAEMTGYAPYHFLVGKYSLGYAEQASASGASVGLVDGLYNDAVRQLGRAVEIDGGPIEPRLELARASLRMGDSEAAAREADAVLERLPADADAETSIEAHRIRAEGSARAYISAKQSGEGDEQQLRWARESFGRIEDLGALDQALRTTWTSLERWAGANARAFAIVERAWKREPAIAGELVDLAAATGTNEAAIAALGTKTDATTRWYLGRAYFNLARSRWAGSDPDGAIESLDSAQQEFTASMADNPDYADSCEQWIAMCVGCRGIVQLSKDELGQAEASFLDAIRRRPDVLANDLFGGSTIKRGILIVGDRYYQAEDLGKVASLYAAAGELAPGDVDFANNHGLFARDHGVEVERAGDKEAAARLFEASYAAYTRAAKLDPANVRLRNDRALLLIYHLDRDLDLAVELLEKAIVDGLAQLADDPPEDADALRNLQEAVGDAYENLGYYYIEHAEDLEKAKANLDEALKYYPNEERSGTKRLLRRLARIEQERAAGRGKGDGR